MKNLLNLIASNKSKTKNTRKTFLAYIDQISDLLSKGYNAKDIWYTMHTEGLIDVQYPSFNRYVIKYIKEGYPNIEEEKAKKLVSSTKEIKPEKLEQKNFSPAVIKKFNHSAEPEDKENLI